MVKNKVIIWSVDNFNTLALIRQIGVADVKIFFLIKGSANYAVKSKYCDEYKETSTIEEGFDFLVHNFDNEEKKPIVLSAGDDIVTYLDVHRDELQGKYILPITSQKGILEKHIDKYNMIILAREVGIVCPATAKIRWNSSLENAIFPCVIKPSHENPGHFNEFKYRICKSKNELSRILRKVRHDSEFVVQQYVKSETDLLVYGSRMFDGKTVVAGILYIKRRSETGSSSYGYIDSELPHCIDKNTISDFLERIDYYGLFSFEYGLYNDNAYFYEVNLRNDGTSHFFYQAGANIPLAYVFSAAGEDYSLVQTSVTHKTTFIDELFDYENVINRKVTKKQWKNDKTEAAAFKYYDKEDPIPFEKAKKTIHKQMLQDFIMNKYRLYIVRILDKMGLKK